MTSITSPRLRFPRQNGFTLLEMLVVVLIIGLLTGIVAPRVLGQLAKSEVTTAKAQMDSFDKALQAYRIDMGRYPTTSEGLQALTQSSGGTDSRWAGPYLKGAIPVDPWGTPFQYASPSATPSAIRDFDIISLGRDKTVGGGGEDADIVNP